MSRAVVVGAGVCGLACAVRLLEAGLAVRVVARERGEATTSARAGAIWLPYLAGPPALVARWGAATYRALERLAAHPADTGVTMAELTLLHGHVLEEEPAWAAAVPPGRVRPLTPGELRPGYADGRVALVPAFDVPRHLAWLEARVVALGGEVRTGVLADGHALFALARREGLVVNCTGLGARELLGDDALVPVAGTLAHVRPRPDARLRPLVDEDGPNTVAYVLPRPDGTAVLGGTDTRGDRRTEPDERTVAGVLERCLRLEPELAGAELLRATVGLRPARPEVRLEAERLEDGALVVHDYGHGGAGYTLGFGCADDVVALALNRAEPLTIT